MDREFELIERRERDLTSSAEHERLGKNSRRTDTVERKWTVRREGKIKSGAAKAIEDGAFPRGERRVDY